jgi:type I restriction enzyme S subunit
MVALEELVSDTQYGTSAKANTDRLGQPVLRMNNITYDGKFDISDLKWIDLPSSEREKLSLRKGDLLFNRTNSRELVGKVGVWNGPGGYTFAGYLVRVRLFEDRVLPGWVSVYMNSPHGKATLFGMAKPSVNMANISASDLLRLKVPVAPLSHQRHAIALIDKADAIRRKRKQAIALTEELLRSAFLEMFGDPVTNPKGWPVSTFGAEVSLLEYGPRFYNEKYADDGMRIVRITDLDASGALDFGSMPRLVVDAGDQARYLLRVGDVIFARSGATVGKTALATEGDPPAIPGAYFIRLRFKDTVSPRYARQVLASSSIQKIIAARSRQSAQQNFSGPGIRELPLPLPPRGAQDRLDAIASGQARHLAQLRHAERNSANLFNALTARAFSSSLEPRC